MKKLLFELFNHERYQTISVVLTALLLCFFYGCQPKCKSLFNPGVNVTRMQLDAEVDSVIAKANIGYASLEQQKKLQELLFEQSLISVTTGAFNPVGLITSVGALLGVGAVTDNVRKRKQIKKLSG